MPGLLVSYWGEMIREEQEENVVDKSETLNEKD
jgi:hypothetical protein